MTTTKEREELETREPAAELTPTRAPRFLLTFFGAAAFLTLAVAIAIVVTRDADVGIDRASDQAFPTIPAEEWALPEMFVPEPTGRSVPAEIWAPPEMSVAEGTAMAAIANWAPPEMSVAEGTAMAAIANWALPEMTIAAGIEAATSSYATPPYGPR